VMIVHGAGSRAGSGLRAGHGEGSGGVVCNEHWEGLELTFGLDNIVGLVRIKIRLGYGFDLIVRIRI